MGHPQIFFYETTIMPRRLRVTRVRRNRFARSAEWSFRGSAPHRTGRTFSAGHGGFMPEYRWWRGIWRGQAISSWTMKRAGTRLNQGLYTLLRWAIT